MKPLKLIMEAFGPFAGREEIDFTHIADHKLFGIYGETGSGKSSIFDAITFALFGNVKQKELDDLPSDHSNENTVCRVEFIFEASNKIYVVERSRTKKSETRKSIIAKSYLFDATGIALNEISDENRGKILAEKKVSDTTKEIEAILGYGLEQFCQIVLLPQGDFQKFLTSKTDDKKQILVKLFDVSLYKNLADRFSEDAKDAHQEIEELVLRKEVQLSTQKLGSLNELNELIILERGKTRELKNEVAKLKTGFEEIKEFKDKYEDLSSKKIDLSNLITRKPEFDKIKENIEKLKNAEKLEPLYMALKEKKTDNAESEKEYSTAVENLQQNLNDIALNKKDLDKIEELKETFSDKRIELEELKVFKERLINSQDKQEKLNYYDRNIKELGFYIDKKELEAQRTNAEAYERKKRGFEEVKENIRRLQTTRLGLKKQLELADKTYKKAEQSLSEMQAIHLSRKLVEGEACPVCGSHDHPNPAKGKAESKGLNDAFEHARKQRDNIKKDYEKEKGELDVQSGRLEVLEEALTGVEAPTLSSEDIKMKILKLGFKKNLEYEQLNEEELKEKRDEKKEMKDQLLGSLKQLVGDIPNELQNIETLDFKINTLNNEITNYDERKKQLDYNEQTFSKNKVGLEAEKRLLKKNKDNTREAVAKAEQKLLKDLENYSFENKEELEIYLPDLSRIKEEEIKWENYDRKMQRLKEDIDKIKQSTKNIDQISGEELEERFNNSQLLFDDAQQELTDNQTFISNLASLKEDIDDTDKKIKELETSHLSLINLSNAFNGKEASQRIGLETFALRKMFELVLLTANKRLSVMTKRRFQMEITKETKGAAQQGLDISVNDVFTGITRAINTLSGGEKFMAALSLALGLSDIAQSSSKKNIHLDTIFIDEGFGSLDNEGGFGALDDVLNTLQDDVASSRAVGIVSHVETVKSAVPFGFNIKKTQIGSHIKLLME